MTKLIDEKFSNFEHDLLFKYKCSIDNFCKSEGVDLVEYFTYLEYNTHLQPVHNKARDVSQKVLEYILKNKLEDSLLSEEFLEYSIDAKGARVELGASIHKLRFFKELLNKTEIQSTNVDIIISSNDL